MTAVASPPSLQSSALPRNAWASGSSAPMDLNVMGPDEVSRMFVPRRGVQRTNSSSSLSSTSSTSTISSPQIGGASEGDLSWATRKKPSRGLWPASRSEPVSGITTARPQSVTAGASNASAASAISSLRSPSPMLPAHQTVQANGLQNGNGRSHPPPGSPAVLFLSPMNGTFERKTITVPFHPDILRIGRQTNQKSIPTPLNGFFDSKVLSRQHAEIWADRDGQIWIRDVKSSNGTFVNSKRLSQENRDSEPHVLKDQDILELGIDIVSEDQKSVVHHKVAARVEHAGFYNVGNNSLEPLFGEGDGSGMGVPNGANHQLRSRPTSQGSSAAYNRLSGLGDGNAMSGHNAKWLQPVTMEQIVKRLNSEVKQARLQSQDLLHTNTFVNAVLSSHDPNLVPSPLQSLNILPPNSSQQQKIHSPSRSSHDVKARFASEPPAPPPSQPLPEKPTSTARSGESDPSNPQPILRRSDTERPKGGSFNAQTSGEILPLSTESSPQILSLIEALTTAKREIARQSERVAEMEELLRQEREARQSVEQQGSASEPEASRETSYNQDSMLQAGQDTDTSSTLQDRLSLVKQEMEELRTQMEQYRHRAETAEEESHRDRQTLAEMVESIGKRDSAIAAKRAKASKRRKQQAQKQNGASPPNKSLTTTSQDDDAAALALEQNDDDIDADEIEYDDKAENVLADEFLPPALMKRARERCNRTTMNGGAKKPLLSETRLKELSQAVNSAIQPRADAQDNSQVLQQWTRAQIQLAQNGPYLSMVGVVLIGVGVMAVVNGWSKGER